LAGKAQDIPPVLAIGCARSPANGLLLVDQTENIPRQGNPFTVSDTGLL
jgi:hypothetical protein